MPVACESVRVIGPDSIMSSALPAGTPSKMSVKTTSASSRSTMRCAVVDPTNPPPTTVTFFLLMPRLVSWKILLCEFSALAASPRLNILFQLPSGSSALHIFNDCGRKCRSPYLRCAGHQPLEIVGYALLLNRPRDAVFDELGGFLPAQKFEHHRAGKHHGTRIDHILVRILWRGAVRGLEHAVTITNVRTRRHAQATDLRRARIRQIIAV